MLEKLKKFITKNEEVIKYLFVGGCTTVVSYVSYIIFSRLFGCDFKLSTILSWIFAVLFAFLTNKTIVFKSKATSKKTLFLEIYNFIKYRVCSLIIDILLMIVMVDLFKINDLIAKLFVQVVIVIVNYIFSKFFVFNKNGNDKISIFNKNDIIYYGFALSLLFLLFGIFLHDHLAPDTMFLYDNGYLGNAEVYFTNGRLVMYSFLWLMNYLEIGFRIAKKISWLIGIMSLFGGIVVLFNMLKKKNNNNWLNIIISFLVVANIFVVEFFYFTEFTGVMCFGIFTAIMSSKYIVSFIDEKRNLDLVKALVYSTLAMFSYQGVMAYVILIPVIFSLKYMNGFKNFVKNNFIIYLNYLIPCVLGVIYNNVVGATRIKGAIVIFESLKKIFKQTLYILVTTQKELPKYVYPLLIAVIGIILIVLIYKGKDKYKNYKFLYLIYCSILMILIPIIPFVIMSTDSIYVSGRSVIALGAIIGLLLMYYLINIKNNKLFNNFIYVIFILIIGLTTFSYQKIALNTFAGNKLDEIEAKKIVEIISDYEKDENIEINSIDYYYDESPISIHSELEYLNDMTIRFMAVDWSNISYINYYSGKKLVSAPLNYKIQEYCSTSNWDDFSEEQLIFDKNTVYVCIY